jgi:ABC-2 type transport system permease protein
MTATMLPTAATTPATDETALAAPSPAAGGTRVSFRGVLRAEAVKLRSVRSSTLTVLATCAAMLIVGLITAAIAGGLIADPGGEEEVANIAGAPLSGTLLAQLVIGVLGVMVITSEFATGLIRSTITAVPARLPVLWAKAVVVVGATLPAVLVTVFGTFLAGQALIGTGDVAAASLGDDGVLRAIFGTGAYLTGVALIGLAIGTVLRATAAGISVLFGVIFLLPGLGSLLLPASWRNDVLQYLPSEAGSAFYSVTPDPALLSSGAGAAVFAAWVLVPLAVAAVALKRRAV